MVQIPVNEIIEQSGITQGLVVLDKTINETMPIIYSEKTLSAIAFTLQQHGGKVPFYHIDRFYQYITLIMYDPFLKFSIKISDFKNNVDTALDGYSELKEKDWLPGDRDKIMRIFQEIQSNPEQKAEMVIKDPVT